MKETGLLSFPVILYLNFLIFKQKKENILLFMFPIY